MGVWREIKHALNNTLGTSNFKPLNTLVTEGLTSLKAELLNEVRLVGSEYVFFAYDGEWENGSATSDNATSNEYRRTSSYIQFDRSGTVIFKLLQSDYDTSTTTKTYTFKARVVDETKAVVGSYEIKTTFKSTGSNMWELPIPINVSPEKKYKLDIYLGGAAQSYLFTKKAEVCATLVFGNSSASLTT